MPRVLVAGAIDAAGVERLRAAPGVEVVYVEDTGADAFHPWLAEAEGLLIRTQPLTAELIAAAPALCIVARHGVGHDTVDGAALAARGIPLTIVGDVNSTSVAEQAMMLLLAGAKRALAADAAVHAGDWGWRDRREAQELAGRTLLVVGYGRIGRRVAQLGAAFGMEVLAHDPDLPGPWPEGPARPVPDLGEALAMADAVSLHLPGGARPVLGAAEIAAMKPGAILVNTARGGVVDEAALARALADGHLGAAGLDVFSEEPPDPDNPLLGLGNVMLSPHIAGLTGEAARRMAEDAAGNILDFFAGRLDPARIVNGVAPHGG